MDHYVVGLVFNKESGEFQAVVGYEFDDCLGYFQFYKVGGFGHFRKRPEAYDTVHDISHAVYTALKEVTRA